MSDKSPLFISALELLAHSTELFAQKNPKRYKFIILHLANAVELILKDCIIDQGISIYEEKSSRTINIWKSFSALESENILIPERPILELLIDDRNTIQHRFGYPNAESVYYYLDEVIAFFKRFLDENYGIQLVETLEDHLTEELLQLLGLVKDEEEQLDKLFELSPKSALVTAYSQVEKLALELIFPSPDPAMQRYPRVMLWRLPEFQKLMKYLEQNGFLPKGGIKRFETLRDMRNHSAHSTNSIITKKDSQAALEIAKEFIVALQKAKSSGYTVSKENDKE
ncbi:MAG: hypothetical protein IIB95_13640 [Candidatus Marinimicrobia bacterium]|nr:hypothetical protein [Candidatus Neomarinimicrobiota bacterium]